MANACDKLNNERCSTAPERVQRCGHSKAGHMLWLNKETCNKVTICRANGVNASCVNAGAGKPLDDISVWSDPKDKREANCGPAVCNPGDRACDKERRFLFGCDKCGQWEKHGTQCWAPGACGIDPVSPSAGLTCTGWPSFGGLNPTCRSTCESLEYLQCKVSTADSLLEVSPGLREPRGLQYTFRNANVSPGRRGHA
jgi:hypothetical protein